MAAPVIAAGIAAGGGLLGGMMSNSANKKAQKRQFNFIREQLGRAEGLLNPYTDMGARALGQYEAFNNEGGAGYNLLQQMGDLDFNVDYQSDPAYLWRLRQQEEMLNRQAAARGGYDSRDAYNMLFDANMALSGQEADKQYARATDQYAREYGNLMNQYKLQNTHLGNLTNMGFNATNSLASLGLGAVSQMVPMQDNTGQIVAGAFNGIGNMINAYDEYKTNQQNQLSAMNFLNNGYYGSTPLGQYNPSFNGGLTPEQWRTQQGITFRP